jgi:cytochrome c biogenesis protein CcdA
MLKRIILPAFSLMFLGIVYLSLFFQAIANQYQTHFLTYRLSYLFIAIGMSFIHVITIFQTPPIKKAVLELFNCLEGRMWKRKESQNTVSENPNTTAQQQQKREEQMELMDCKEIKLSQSEEETVSN